MGFAAALHALVAAAILAAPPAPTQPAGTVVAVTGAVTATSPGKPAHTLAVKDVVRGEDVIATPKGGAISVRFEFNNVVWTLRGGMKRKVSDSLAWSAPLAVKSDPLFSNVPDATGLAAGRDGTIGAAQSVAALQQAASNSEAGGAGASASDELSVSKKATANGRAVSKEKTEPAAKSDSERRPPSPSVEPEAPASSEESTARSGDVASVPQPPPPPPPPVAAATPAPKHGWFDWLFGTKSTKASAPASREERASSAESTAGGGARPPAASATPAPGAGAVPHQPGQVPAVGAPVGLGGKDATADKTIETNKPAPGPADRTPRVASAAPVTLGWKIEVAGGRTPHVVDGAMGAFRIRVARNLPAGSHAVVRFVIGADGTVSDIIFVESNGMTPEAVDAVTRALGELKLPKGKSATTIRLEIGAPG